MTRLLAAFYGDDFTGSTENLAQFSRHGLRGRLFFSSAGREAILDMAPELDVVGLAGTARGLAPGAMTVEVEPALAVIEALAPQLMQFKVCSTFDSSPTVGSIGHVMELARQRWPGCALPVLPATPAFGRFTAFSHLFTRYQGEICRLDQNPAMAYHPSTPMTEADLRRHLAAQTTIAPAAVTLLDYRQADGGWQALWSAIEAERFAVLDATDQAELQQAAELILRLADHRPTLAVAAQGLADAVGRAVTRDTMERPPLPTTYPGVARLLVLSGSCSPQTRAQLAHFESLGGGVLSLPPEEALRDAPGLARRLAGQVAAMFGEGRDVAVATTRSEADVIVDLSTERLATAVGEVFARLTRELRDAGDIQRVVFAGGDTSSHAMRQLGADALELAAFDEAQGGHLCRLVATDSPIDGLEVVLKGGQIGGEDLLARVKRGTSHPAP
ncbi:four-carbon acid sugar kinase family protein [Halomonas rhizosphaerae]|uniref:Four-carbon acid sugar kinase family protein n=1 Tax=Halomonas rhizosphaerae TaxID=3043296 RepID=A0ABT6V1Q6_9GAMM|nr:four-carbon acid sugar kinase family protein [Halomonas rhizosphaerae]MDI5892131.1 four-carbon acid sugar kinase family protein [Halomonas rhizosphaerae]MDI5920422.1 four-carbon acid sugar kinase family protein [Halomonas rhizosphaerae]